MGEMERPNKCLETLLSVVTSSFNYSIYRVSDSATCFKMKLEHDTRCCCTVAMKSCSVFSSQLLEVNFKLQRKWYGEERVPLTTQRMYNRISDPRDVSLMLRGDKKNDPRGSQQSQFYQFFHFKACWTCTMIIKIFILVFWVLCSFFPPILCVWSFKPIQSKPALKIHYAKVASTRC